MAWLKKQTLSIKKKLFFALFIALIMEFFIGVVLVNAQVADPIFTNTSAVDLAGFVHPSGEIRNVLGQDYFIASTTQAIGGCTGTFLRSGSMQWNGTAFAYVGGGSSVSCPVNDNFYELGDEIFVNLLTGTDGFYCQISGTSSPLTESTLVNRLCVEIANGEPAVLYDPDNLQDLIIPPTPPQTTFLTKFTDATATGLSSTTVSFDVDYFLNTSEFSANSRPDAITINVLADGFFNDTQVGDGRRLILPLSDGNFSQNVPVEYSQGGGFPDGNYIGFVNFYNININGLTFSYTNVTVEFEISGGIVISSTVIDILDGENLDDIEYENCSITNLSGCFQNAMIYVFVPDSDSLDRFTTLYERIETKPPFGYVTSLRNSLDGVTTGTSSAFTFGTIPLQNEVFDPFKALLAIGLWVIYAFYFMGRLDKIDI